MPGSRIQIRRGNADFWDDENPVLRSGEPGYEKNTGRMKIGDGLLPWKELPYFTAPGGSNYPGGGGGTGGGGSGGGGLPLDPEDPDLVSFYNNGKV